MEMFNKKFLKKINQRGYIYYEYWKNFLNYSNYNSYINYKENCILLPDENPFPINWNYHAENDNNNEDYDDEDYDDNNKQFHLTDINIHIIDTQEYIINIKYKLYEYIGCGEYDMVDYEIRIPSYMFEKDYESILENEKKKKEDWLQNRKKEIKNEKIIEIKKLAKDLNISIPYIGEVK